MYLQIMVRCTSFLQWIENFFCITVAYLLLHDLVMVIISHLLILMTIHVVVGHLNFHNKLSLQVNFLSKIIFIQMILHCLGE